MAEKEIVRGKGIWQIEPGSVQTPSDSGRYALTQAFAEAEIDLAKKLGRDVTYSKLRFGGGFTSLVVIVEIWEEER